jgi:hypothetical protein
MMASLLALGKKLIVNERPFKLYKLILLRIWLETQHLLLNSNSEEMEGRMWVGHLDVRHVGFKFLKEEVWRVNC